MARKKWKEIKQKNFGDYIQSQRGQNRRAKTKSNKQDRQRLLKQLREIGE